MSFEEGGVGGQENLRTRVDSEGPSTELSVEGLNNNEGTKEILL